MMTPKQFRSALDRLGLSQLGAGRLFGTGERTPRRWASGETPIPDAVAALLNLMLSGRATVDEVEAAKRGKLVESTDARR